ncbi:MAG: hypothetical protein JF619_04205 [Massilia sp.]|nr:hypothetical protein [Massilia sp.]
MTSYLGRMGDTDAHSADPTDAPGADSLQLAEDADRAELRRALLVYGMAGALGVDHARGASGDVHG